MLVLYSWAEQPTLFHNKRDHPMYRSTQSTPIRPCGEYTDVHVTNHVICHILLSTIAMMLIWHYLEETILKPCNLLYIHFFLSSQIIRGIAVKVFLGASLKCM
jgi:hypothetical protein